MIDFREKDKPIKYTTSVDEAPNLCLRARFGEAALIPKLQCSPQLIPS